MYAALMPFSLGSTASHAAVLTVQHTNCVRLLPGRHVCAESVRIAVGLDRDPQTAVQEAMRRVQQSLPAMNRQGTAPFDSAPTHPCSLIRNRGYCTWNGFYQNITHDSLVSAISTICNAVPEPKQTPFAWVLIDDGWQNVDKYDGYGRLYDIRANSDKFPGQLQQTVDALSKLEIRRVGVWHTLWGYWGGIDPAGPLAEQYTLVKCNRAWTSVVKGESDVWLISPKSVHKFYNNFYRWLSEQGISFVKVDYQAAFESLVSCADRSSEESRVIIAEMYAAYYDAMERAALKYFGSGSIMYCMDQSPHLITRTLQHQHQRQQQQQSVVDERTTECMIFRNSDDYFPDIAASHGWHIYCNMANTIWSRCLSNYFAIDWDMFQPGKAESHVHAAARIVSGGPVYMTGRASDFAAENMCELNIVPHEPPLLDNSCLFTDMTKSPAALTSTIAVPNNDSVVVVLFNTSSDPVITPVPLCSMFLSAIQRQGDTRATPLLKTGGAQPGVVEYFAILQMSTNRLQIISKTPLSFAIALLPLACDTITIARMIPMRTSAPGVTLYATCLGDTGQYVGVAAVERSVHSTLLSSPLSIDNRNSSSKNSGKHQWNVRARVIAGISQVAFAFSAKKTTNDAVPLILSVSHVRVSGRDISDTASWRFDSKAGLLDVKMCPSATPVVMTIQLCA